MKNSKNPKKWKILKILKKWKILKILKNSKIQKNQKDKNTKKLKNKNVPLMKTWQTGVMVAKKDFCQEGENLVNRRLLHFMLHLAAHLLASHAVAFVLFAFLL